VDAKRDLRDIGAVDIPLLSLTSAGYGDLAESFDEGVLVVTYSVLVASSGGATRFDQLMKWLTPAFDGVLLFDEAHKAKGAAHGQPVGTSVVQLQASLPNARVMYLSATGATQVGDMSYMTRLGLWGTGTFFQNFKSFQSVLTSGSGSGSSGSMEMLAVQLKSSGAYLARSLGLRGVDFHMVQAKLTPAQQTLYDQSASLWVFIHQQLGQLSFLFRSGGMALNSAQSKFFQQLLLSFKVPEIERQVRRALHAGKCAVIGLQSTGEAADKAAQARSEAAGSSSQASLVSPAREAVEGLLAALSKQAAAAAGGGAAPASFNAFRDEVIEKLDKLDLPPSALDALIDYFGAEHVAEMTGRSKRMLKASGGSGYVLCSRAERGTPASRINLAERKRFQSGEKLIAILSDAGATGVSLHADKNEANQRRRVHIVPELGWSASKVVQQFGRTHRTNQLLPPEYVLLTCEAAGEALTGSAVARKLEGLGALTKGDKMAGRGETGGLGTNLETKAGGQALSSVIAELRQNKWRQEGGAALEQGKLVLDDGVHDLVINSGTVKQFLNRLQLVSLTSQLEVLKAFVSKIKKEDTATAQQLAATTVTVKSEEVVFSNAQNVAESVTVREIECDHSCDWKDALAQAGDQSGFRGFWCPRGDRDTRNVFLVLPIDQHRGRLCLPRKRWGPTHWLADIAQKCAKYSLTTPQHTEGMKRVWECNLATARRDGTHLEKFALLNGSVFTIWPNLREAFDPRFNPDDRSTWHLGGDQMYHRRGGRAAPTFEPNVRIQLLTTSEGEKLGGIRMSLFKPLKHAPRARWSEHCNRKNADPGLMRTLAQSGLGAESIICRKHACLEPSHSEVDKLRKSLEKDTRRARS